MLGILITTLITYLIAKWRNIELNLNSITKQKNIMILIIALTIIFWFLHIILSKNKDVRRYVDNWQEDEIRFIRFIVVLTQAILYRTICLNLYKGEPIYHEILVEFAVIVAANIVQMIMINHFYSSNFFEVIVDSVLMQIQDCRNTLLVILAISCMMNWTILGFIFILSFFAIIFRW